MAGVVEPIATARVVTSERLGARVGWAVFAATSLACVVTVGLDVYTGSWVALGYACVAQALALMGVLLTTRLPRHRISWVIAIDALWSGLAGLTNAYAVVALVEHPGSLPGGVAAAWFDNWAWLPGIALFLCALLVLMPDGHLASRRWWPVPTAVALGTVFGSIAASGSATFELRGTEVPNPRALDNVVLGVAGIAGAVLVLGGLVASLAAFVVRYRRSEGESRQQLRWVVASFVLAVPLAFGALLWGVVPGAAILPALALLTPPAGIAVAILRYRLYDLDLVVNRAAVYGALTVAIGATYLLAVALVGSSLSRRGGFAVSLAVTGVVAVAFHPLRARLQRLANRLMYGRRDDPYAAIAGLGRTLAGSLQADAVVPAAVETIGRSLALGYVAVTADAERELAAYGTPGAEVLVLPLIHQGAAVGELRLSPRSGESLRERDRRLVDDLVPQVAAAVHAAGLSQELQSARRRIVRLREEERRRIRRDLHDGLGPALAGLTFTLDASRNLADSDQTRADELLASALEQVQAMIGDVRRLIYGLRPPALDELGLVESLRGLAAREGSGETRIDVDAPDSLPPLEAAVEVAAYRIVQEALTNVTRHAHAERCAVRLSLEPTALLVEVSDDGRGFSQRGSGVGLHTMRERAAELEGVCEITSIPGTGTTVSARLPLA